MLLSFFFLTLMSYSDFFSLNGGLNLYHISHYLFNNLSFKPILSILLVAAIAVS